MVLCERIMSRGYEPRVARLMENVKAIVRAQPGFISIDTYAQVEDHTKYVVFSEVSQYLATAISYVVLLLLHLS